MGAMVTVSPKFQVVIPAEIRENLHIKPGERLAVIEKGGQIHLVPMGAVEDLFGFAQKLTEKGLREKHERFD